MRKRAAVLVMWMMAMTAPGEVLDRVAVSIGTRVITESEVLEQIRVRAFLEGIPAKYDEDAKRDAADKLIQQTLIRREMETARYAAADPALAEQLLASFKKDRFAEEGSYQKALAEAKLTEGDVRAAFGWQLTVLRFVEFRFRPGIQIPREEIEEYYTTRFAPEWKRRTPQVEAPSVEQAEQTIETILAQERIDNALDRWLSQTRTQVNIKVRDEVFRGK